MTNKLKHIENQPELNREVSEMISGASIAWSNSKEEIWPEMLKKIEGEGFVARTPKTIYLQVLKYAAVVILLLCIPAVMFFYTKTIESSLTPQTEVTLPDDSKAVIYAHSVLSYKPLWWRFNRSVKFEGEGLFEVQKGRKFEVVSSEGKTVVLGTQFYIYARNSNYEVTCISGKVKVVELTGQNEVIIASGQKATLKPGGNFEITSDVLPKVPKKSENQSMEDELEEILSKFPPQLQAHSQTKSGMATEKHQPETEQKTADKQNAVNQPENYQKQVAGEVQNNKEPSNTSSQLPAGNKAQEKNQDQIKVQSAGNQQSNDKFKASLTSQQISILENQQMSKDEKKKAFMKSLSPEQLKLLEEQNKERSQQKAGNKQETFGKEGLKDRQKWENKENSKSDGRNNGFGGGQGNQPGKGN